MLSLRRLIASSSAAVKPVIPKDVSVKGDSKGVKGAKGDVVKGVDMQLSALRAQLQQGNTAKAVDTFTRMHINASSSLSSLNSRDYSALYNAIRKTPRSNPLLPVKQSLTQMLKNMDYRFKASGIKPSATLFVEKALILRRLGVYRKGYSDALEALFLEMEERGLTRPTNSACMMIESHANGGRIAEATRLFNILLPILQPSNLLPQLTPAYHSILDAHTLQSPFPLVQSWYLLSTTLSIPKNAQIYDSYLSALSKEGLLPESRLVLQEKRDKGFGDSTRGFNLVLRCAVNGEKWDEALGVFREMAERGVGCSAGTYTMLMGVYSKVDDPISVLRVYFSMLTAKIVPDMFTSRKIGETFSNVSHARSLKQLVQKANGHLSMRLLRTILLGIFDHSVHLVRLRTSLTSTRSNSLKTPSQLLADTNELARVNLEIDKCAASSKAMFELYRVECGISTKFVQSPDLYTLHASILAHSNGEKATLERILSSVGHLNLQMTQGFYTRLMYCAGRMRDAEFAEKIWMEMVAKGVARGMRLYEGWIGAVVGDVPVGEKFSDAVVEVLRKMARDVTMVGNGNGLDGCGKLMWVLGQIDIGERGERDLKVYFERCMKVVRESEELVLVNKGRFEAFKSEEVVEEKGTESVQDKGDEGASDQIVDTKNEKNSAMQE